MEERGGRWGLLGDGGWRSGMFCYWVILSWPHDARAGAQWKFASPLPQAGTHNTHSPPNTLAEVFRMATLVAIQERGRGSQTGSASPRGSSRSSRHCRAAPAHYAATQWFLLTFHFKPVCAFRTPFSLCAPSLFSSALGSTQRSRVQKQYLRNAELSLSLSSGASPVS